jgi:hypothetical protein
MYSISFDPFNYLTSGNPYKEFCPTAENQGPTLYFYTLGFPRGGGVSNQSVSKHYTE